MSKSVNKEHVIHKHLSNADGWSAYETRQAQGKKVSDGLKEFNGNEKPFDFEEQRNLEREENLRDFGGNEDY